MPTECVAAVWKCEDHTPWDGHLVVLICYLYEDSLGGKSAFAAVFEAFGIVVISRLAVLKPFVRAGNRLLPFLLRAVSWWRPLSAFLVEQSNHVRYVKNRRGKIDGKRSPNVRILSLLLVDPKKKIPFPSPKIYTGRILLLFVQ